MKCEECLQLIEEYFDGELAERTALLLSAHLAHCSACANVAEGLRLETEIYRSYERPITVTPALWPAIKARIENESKSRASRSGVKAFGWLPSIFDFPLLAPTLAALATVALCVSLGVMYLKRSHELESSRAQVDSSTINPQSGGDVLKAPLANTGAATSPTNAHVERTDNNFNRRREIVRRRKSASGVSDVPLRSFIGGTSRANAFAQNKQPPAQTAQAPRSVERPPTTISPAALPPPDDSAAARNAFPTAGGDPNEYLGDPDAGWRTHAERAQMLLRSFRNVPLAEATENPGRRIDVAYERRMSKKLLYDNIVLRREAAARGDRSTERLLDNLEPILLDIANLPERPRPDDVRSIEGRMQKEEIVARLQVQSLSARNSFD